MEVNQMPHGDGTGPLGLGPGTGWGLGYCAGYNHPGYLRTRGLIGRGAGHRNRFWAAGFSGWQQNRMYGWYQNPGPLSEEDEITFLSREAEDLERALGEVKSRLQEMEKNRK